MKYDIATNLFSTWSKNVSIFQTINNEHLVAYSTGNCIELYDLSLEKIVKTKPNAHEGNIILCKHYLEENLYKNDLLISTSNSDNVLKVWNLTKDFSNILVINNVCQDNMPYLANLIFEKEEKKLYLVTCGRDSAPKIWDWSGKFVKDFDDQMGNYKKHSIEFYDKLRNTNYLIYINYNDTRAYEFKTRKLYKKYDGNSNTYRFGLLLYDLSEVLTLIELDDKGNIRFWDFHKGELKHKIELGSKIFGISLWNEKYIICGGENEIKIVDSTKGNIIKTLSHKGYVRRVNTIIHPKYGECLISFEYNVIKLWTSQN